MTKRSEIRKLKKQKRFLIFVIFLLVILNIILIHKYVNKGKELTPPTEIVKDTEVIEEFDENRVYYTAITYKKFKEIFKGHNLSYVAVVNNSSPTYEKYINLINKMSFYNKTKIYVLETTKLSKSSLKSFYDIDRRLSELESNIMIIVQNNEILALNIFESEKLEDLTEGVE